MSENDLNNLGIILPYKVTSYNYEPCQLINKLVVFQPKEITYKGIVKWFGQINDYKAYGIETDSIREGTNGEFNGKRIFSCKSECGVLIKDTCKLLEIDQECGSICNKHWDNFKILHKIEYSKTDFYVVRFVNSLKIGKILEYGDINGILCLKLITMEHSKNCIFITSDVLGKFANGDGIVNSCSDGVFNTIKFPDVFNAEIGRKVYFKCDNKYEAGILKWKGKIDSLKCIGIVPHSGKLAGDFRKHFPTENDAYWTVICLNTFGTNQSILYEISDPIICEIFTYFKKSAYVNVGEDDGTIEAYLTDGKQFFYEVKLQKDKELTIVKYADVKCGFTGINHERINASFEEITDPNQFGIVTELKINDNVKINPDAENKLDSVCYGSICWMGFDKDSNLKYFLRLDQPNKNGNNGILYGAKLGNVADKCGLLVRAGSVVPVAHKIKEISADKSSEIVDEYQFPRSRISYGNEKGIQGDKNSCYMDTSFFTMFAFQEIFDNLFLSKENDNNSKIRNIMSSRIIFPLRKNEYVSYDRVTEFREVLGELFPNKKFIHSEKDPEELLETLFHLLTPNDPLLRTFDIITHKKQNCFMTQLFYVNESTKSNITKISDMLYETFSQGRFLMNKPPKCLILQLPRHGTQYKQYSEVLIEPKINISHLIRYGKNKCKTCSKLSSKICLECGKGKFVYYCSTHEKNCTHEKFDLKLDKNKMEKMFKPNVELELFGILCIEKTHYVAYAKTGEVKGNWIYYDSMSKTDNHVLIPEIRETDIGKYFQSNMKDESDSEHVIRIKKFAFVCFYKNPTLEYYIQDFNHVK